MQRYKCECGQAVFFDNTQCTSCGSSLGFAVNKRRLLSFDRTLDQIQFADGEPYRRCRNAIDHTNCNWLIEENDTHDYCVSCRLNRTIPHLAKSENANRWRTIEAAKRRLVYSLLGFALPLQYGDGLAFDFVEDQRTNTSVTDQFVPTHYAQGVITINVAEADDVTRIETREQLRERYRTLLGHFRHESAHFYFAVLLNDEARLARFRAVFGDEREDYDTALANYYRVGASDGWQSRFVSAYASAHPSEDWAETWAHYLHMHDCLETAQDHGLIVEPARDFDSQLASWRQFSVTLNELNRSMGLDDAYPFVIPQSVATKLRFVHELLAG